jgi:membrane-associated phospholipid phosphatase
MPRRARVALDGAIVTVALLVLTWAITLHVGFVERADESIFHGFVGLNRPRVGSVALSIASLCNPDPYVYLAAVPVIVALCRRRVRVAAVIAAILLGANLTTQLLKPALAVHHPGLGTGAWPSGHATAAMSLALCCVLAAPARWRPAVAALGGVFAVAVSYSFLTLGWHYPSDVLGGFLVATAWTLLGVAAVLGSYSRHPHAAQRAIGTRLTVGEALGPLALVLVGALALVVVVLLARPHGVVEYARMHKAFIVGAAAIGVFGLALASGLTLALRSFSGSGPAPTGALRPRSPRGSG